MSKAFDKADKLANQRPLPADILDQLAELEKQVEPYEKRNFAWIYEGVYLELDDKGVED